MVLKFCGNDVLFAILSTPLGGREDGLVVGLAAARGKIDFPRLGVQAGRDGLPGFLQGGLGRLARRVQAGGVAVNLLPKGLHGFYGRPAHPCGGRVVGVYMHVFRLL